MSSCAERFAALALKCLHSEYPNHISHTLSGDDGALPPHVLYPAFYGCFDWHSDVHGHWLLVRLLRLYPDAPFAAQARSELKRSFTAQNMAGELRYLQQAGRASFERPYGLAWLLQLSAELRAWNDPQAHEWAAALQPLETEAASRLKTWIPKLHYPIRIGEHDQTAFSFGLAWDWAGIAGDTEMRRVLTDAAQRFYVADRHCPIDYEPSGEDFLSPCLAEADFMRRVLEPAAFGHWLSGFLPQIPQQATAAVLRAAAQRHREAALPAVTGEHYEGGHWLGTFAVYLTSGAGI